MSDEKWPTTDTSEIAHYDKMPTPASADGLREEIIEITEDGRVIPTYGLSYSELLEIVCRGGHNVNGPACEKTCGVVVNQIAYRIRARELALRQRETALMDEITERDMAAAALRQELEGLAASWKKRAKTIRVVCTQGRYDDGRADARSCDADELQAILGKHSGAAPEQGGEKR